MAKIDLSIENLRTKKASEKRAWGKFIRLFLLIVFLFFVGNLFVQIPPLIKKIQRPFETYGKGFANSKKLDLSSRASLLLLNYDREGRLEQAWVATYEASGKQISFVIIPTEIPITTKLDRKLSLRELIQEDFDRAFWEVATLVGSPLEGYVAFSDSSRFSQESILSARKSVLSLGFFLTLSAQKSWLDGHLKTNLTLGDLFNVFRSFKAVSTEALNFVDLGESVTGSSFDNEKLTNQTKPIFIDSEVADEAASVKIINGSQVPGAGALFKRLVTNLGGRVVGVDSQKSSATIIKVSTDKKKLATKISRFLDTKVEREKGEPTADVVIILGADLVKKLDLN